MTNAKFAETDQDFRKACEKADIKPTRRQASRWRRKKGLAWRVATGKEGRS